MRINKEWWIMENKSNYKKFLLLWSGEFISSIGGGLTSFGLSVYVFQKTGSAASMAVVALLAFLPVLLLSPVAGVLADRYDRCPLLTTVLIILQEPILMLISREEPGD